MAKHDPQYEVTEAQAAGVQHEPGNSLTQPNWPIVVGGEYADVSGWHRPGLRRRVCAVDGDTIYFRLLHPDGFLGESVHANTSNVFRGASAPNDESPLPQMYAALEAAYKVLTKEHIYLFDRVDALGLVTAALATKEAR